MMSIMLVQAPSYIAAGGINKANRLLLEGLAARGHQCRVVVPAGINEGLQSTEAFLEELRARQIAVRTALPHVVIFDYHGVEVHAVTEATQIYGYLIEQIRAVQPTWVLAADEPTDLMLDAALEASQGRVVYLAHSSIALPFGPMCFLPSSTKTSLIQQTAGVITVSEYMRAYIQQWAGIAATVIPFPVYGAGPFPRLGRFDHGAVTIINPSDIKGISIFLALARRFPQQPFAAVPTWATTAADRAALAALPNVQLLPPSDAIDTIFAQTRVLLVPSLWDEAFGLVTVEAMLRGIPVLASNVGGLPEAKLGVPYVLPVRPITQYKAEPDDRMLPVAEVPPQEIEPWAAALGAVLGDAAHYAALADASAQAAHAFVAQLGIAPFERFLQQLEATYRTKQAQAAQVGGSTAKAEALRTRLDHLSPEQRALLAKRLSKQETHTSPDHESVGP